MDDHQAVDRVGEDTVTTSDCSLAGRAVVRASRAAETITDVDGSLPENRRGEPRQARVAEVDALLTDATE